MSIYIHLYQYNLNNYCHIMMHIWYYFHLKPFQIHMYKLLKHMKCKKHHMQVVHNTNYQLKSNQFNIHIILHQYIKNRQNHILGGYKIVCFSSKSMQFCTHKLPNYKLHKKHHMQEVHNTNYQLKSNQFHIHIILHQYIKNRQNHILGGYKIVCFSLKSMQFCTHILLNYKLHKKHHKEVHNVDY